MYPGTTLRTRVEARSGLLVPRAAHALAASVTETLGFDALYLDAEGLQGWGAAAMGPGASPPLIRRVAASRAVTRIPIVVDGGVCGDTGWDIKKTVRAIEDAGANALFLHDRSSLGADGDGGDDRGVRHDRTAARMVEAVQAAVDARRRRDFLIIATTVRPVSGLEQALDRSRAYAAAGADLGFVRRPRGSDELQRIACHTTTPQVVDAFSDAQAPRPGGGALSLMGFGLVLWGPRRRNVRFGTWEWSLQNADPVRSLLEDAAWAAQAAGRSGPHAAASRVLAALDRVLV
ncbi:MAG: isocitrate lyase/phosphoenolpyruvate mutase family protein [Pseudomonadota bacterium]